MTFSAWLATMFRAPPPDDPQAPAMTMEPIRSPGDPMPADAVSPMPVHAIGDPDDKMTMALVKACWPACVSPASWPEALSAAFHRFDITTPHDRAAFMAVCAQESGQGNVLVENLNYSAKALVAMFSAFASKPALADHYGRTATHPANQEAIGNIAYGGRMGNGPTDGYANRGAGLIQTTGAANMKAGAKHFGLTVESYRDWLKTPAGAAMGSALYWSQNGLSAYAGKASAAGFRRLSGAVNRGNPNLEPVDWPARLAHYDRCRRAFGLAVL